MTVSSSIKYAVFRSSTIVLRFSAISSERMPSLPRLVSMLCDLLSDLMRSTRRMYPRAPRLNPLPLLQLRLSTGLHRRLYALLSICSGRGCDPGREGPFDEGSVDQGDLFTFLRGQHLQDGLCGENGAAEVHEHEHLVGFEVAYGGFDPLRVRAERAVGVTPHGRDLDLSCHLQDQVSGPLGDLLAVRDEHDPDHQEEPSSVRAAASRSINVEVAPGS